MIRILFLMLSLFFSFVSASDNRSFFELFSALCMKDDAIKEPSSKAPLVHRSQEVEKSIVAVDGCIKNPATEIVLSYLGGAGTRLDIAQFAQQWSSVSLPASDEREVGALICPYKQQGDGNVCLTLVTTVPHKLQIQQFLCKIVNGAQFYMHDRQVKTISYEGAAGEVNRKRSFQDVLTAKDPASQTTNSGIIKAINYVPGKGASQFEICLAGDASSLLFASNEQRFAPHRTWETLSEEIKEPVLERKSSKPSRFALLKAVRK